jgi:predicted esterase
MCGARRAVQLTVLGFSQGAAMAARWLARRPVPVSRVVLWGTSLPSDVDPVELGRQLQGRPVWLVAGARDAYAPADAVEAAVAGLAAGGALAATHRYQGGHRVEPEPLIAIREAGRPA